MNAPHARKNVSSWITPVIHPIVNTMEQTSGSDNERVQGSEGDTRVGGLRKAPKSLQPKLLKG